MYTRSPKLSYDPPGIKENQELHIARMLCKFPLDFEDCSHFSNWGSRRPMTNWSTSTINLSPALAFPPIGSRSCRCSIMDRTKSRSSSCAERANVCTICGSTVGYGINEEEEVEEDAIERTGTTGFLGTLAFEANLSAFYRKSGGGLKAGYALYRLDQRKSEANPLRWKEARSICYSRQIIQIS